MSTNEASQFNLLDTIFSTTDEGVVSLAVVRDSAGCPFDFQIVHLNRGRLAAAEANHPPICCGAGSAPEETRCVAGR